VSDALADRVMHTHDENPEAALKRDVMMACATGKVAGHFLVILTDEGNGTHGAKSWTNANSRWELWGVVLEGLVRAALKESS